MRQITVQPLTREAFARYGVFQDLLDDEGLARVSIFPSGFFADVVPMDFGHGNLPTASVCSLTRTETRIISFIEYHQYTCEGLLPMDSDVILFVGVPPMGALSVDALEAFYVKKGTFVRLNPLIIHGAQFPVEDRAHVLCLLAGRTFKNDMQAKRLEGDDQVEIV